MIAAMANRDENQLSPLKRAFRALEQANARIAELEARRAEPVAIIGMGCRFPGGADNPAAYWRLLSEGRDVVTEVPGNRWDVDAYYSSDPAAPDKMSVRRAAFLGRVDEFDAGFFGISPREAQYVDPQQRLLLEVAWEALEHAGIPPRSLGGSATGVFTGMCKCDYAGMLDTSGDPNRFGMYSAAGRAYSMGSGRLSYTFGFQGPSITVDTACSSSLVALHLACQSLKSGECRLALACGVNLILSPDNTISFSKAEMMSPDGICHTFDAAANGFVQGEGCGVVVLKRLSDATADGDRVIAVIRATAANQDGPSGGLTVPNGAAQEAVMRQALASAGVAAAEVDYVEAHGTGTSLGDPIEARALGAVYGPGREKNHPLLIGSVKTNMGHLESAAGIASVIKVALALEHRAIPPHLHFRSPSPHIDWEHLPLRVVTALEPWNANQDSNGATKDRRRLAGISSFGFSGTNVHAILAEAPERPATGSRPDRAAVFAISARDGAALDELVARHVDALRADAGRSELAAWCRAAAAGRSHFSHRLACCPADRDDLQALLSARLVGSGPAGIMEGQRHKAAPPRVAFLFTGQGSQYAGMGRALYRRYAAFRSALDQCTEALRPHIEIALPALLFGDDVGLVAANERLTQTGHAQPALFALEYALAMLWQSWGVRPAAVAGHSVGEYAAACIAGVLELEDAAKLIAARGRLMQRLPAGGSMVAVLAGVDRVARAVEESGASLLAIAAVNGPANTVVSGPAHQVKAVVRRMEADNASCHLLNVSHAFHSPLMEPVLAEFASVLRTVRFGKPRVTFVSNLTGRSVTGGEIGAADYWLQQIVNPVRFADCMRVLAERGCEVFIEAGPHPVLIGQGRMCLDDEDRHWLPSMKRPGDDAPADDDAVLVGSVARYHAAGGVLDWSAYYGAAEAPGTELPTYPFQRKPYWFKPGPQRRGAGTGKGEHPLLGSRIPTPLHAALFRNSLSTEQLTFVDAHVVHERTIVPATAYLEMAIAAAGAVGVTGAMLVDATLTEALVLVDGEVRELQVVMDRAGNEDFRARIYSAGPDGAWKLHFETLVTSVRGATLGPVHMAARPVTCEGRTFYERLAKRGLTFGAALKGVRAVSAGEAVAIGEIACPAEIAPELPAYSFHPALLDACLQVIAAAVPGFDSTDERPLYMPFSIDRCSLKPARSQRLESHVILTEQTAASLTASVAVLDENGDTVASIEGLRLKRVGASDLQQATALDDALYRLDWQPADSASLPLDAVAASVAGNRSFGRMALEYGLEDYLRRLSELDAICAAFIAEALSTLGWQPRIGANVEAGALAEELRIVPRFRPLLGRFLAILADSGILRADSRGFTVAKAAVAGQAAPALARLAEVWADGKAETALVARCGPELAAVLSGKADPLALLFPGGDTEAGAAIYTSSPAALTYNAAIADAVGALVRQVPAGRKLRVLEVGGGTGGTTRFILDRVETERLDYHFTDVGPLFVSRARERFGSHGCMSFGLLDLETSPASQGYDRHGYDLVIASNVLHATRDLRLTLGYVNDLLTSEGALLLSEVVTRQPWIDISFGMTEGWWLFKDTALRPDYPLLEEQQWRRLLEEAGFLAAEVVPAELEAEKTNSILVAVRDGAREKRDAMREGTAEDRMLLCFADASGAAARLAETWPGRVITVTKGVASDLGNAVHPVIDPDRTEDFNALLDVVGEPACIAWLWPLDMKENGCVVDGEACRPLLGLVQALARRGAAPREGLWLVTAGGQAPGRDASGLEPQQSTVWGFGKVIAQEHPELHCRRFDLDPSDIVTSLESLRRTMAASGVGEEFACRDGRVLEARLVRAALPETPGTDVTRRLDSSSRGQLDNLFYREVERGVPGDREVEISVRASGLNFRDVLNALGTYSGGEVPFGSECAGVVTAVGPSVTGLQPGDEVVAIALHALGERVLAHESLVVQRPPQLTWSEAACLPIAFVTAHHCLHAAGRLARGERVLIHAGAGGVGMAAIQLALAAGARVYATAGSEAKRDYLRRLGVVGVYDSRSLAFSEALLADTGGAGADVLINSLSGDFIPASIAATARGGRFIEIGRSGIWTADQVGAVRADVEYSAIDLSEEMLNAAPRVRAILCDVMQRLAGGRLQPLPVRTFARDETVAAFRYMAQARHIGKIAIMQPIDEDSLVGPRGAYLVTGGLRGLGLLVAERLVERGAGSLVLTGRNAPSPGAEAAIRRMKERGTEVHVVTGNIGDEGDVVRLFEKIATLSQPLRGIVHSAGALADAPIVQQDWAHFRTVFAAKITGTRLLARYAEKHRLDFFVLFSSIASVLGSSGQANHCAANAFMDVFAHRLRALDVPATSINWGIWSGTGAAVDHAVIERAAARGLGAIEQRGGLGIMESLICSQRAQAIVQPIDWQLFLPTVTKDGRRPALYAEFSVRATASAAAPAPVRECGSSATEQLAGLPATARPAFLAGIVRRAAATVLALEDATAIPADLPLKEAGLDSLLAVEMRNALGKALDRRLPSTLLFDYPTISAVVGFLETTLSVKVDAGVAATEANSGESEGRSTSGMSGIDDLLDEVERLSADEAERLVGDGSGY